MNRKSTRSIGEVISSYVKEAHLEEGLLRARIFDAWDRMKSGTIVLGACTSYHSFRDGVLTCRINSSVVRSHLQMQSGLLLARLNESLGGEYVKQLKLT
ncbi:MAG: DUF721 domain-containing protein [Bacteroidales bacterium]|nr:DUF721 domain-containing protein [Bacteroidales bacterium]